MLVNQLEKELEEDIVARTAAMQALDKRMVYRFQGTVADLRKNAEKMVGRTNQVEDEWRMRQKSLLASIDSALITCNTSLC